ncbi:MAG: PucR family transcriptional regulator [Mycobacterium sp.]
MTEVELAAALSAASHGARAEVPLSALLTAYNVASRVGMEAAQELATPSELSQVLLVASGCQRYLHQLVPAMTTAYLEQERSPHHHLNLARRNMFSALMKGAPSAETTKRANMTLASLYSVMHLRLLTPCGTAMARRRVNRIQDILDSHVDEPVLTSLDAQGGTILLPTTGLEESLMGPFAEIADGPVIAGLSHAAPTEIASAAQEARDVAMLASDLGRTPGLFRLHDLLVEYQLTRPSRARDLLTERLKPLIDLPHLKQALTAYLQHEHSRKLAAKSLFIHPNTLDYRLRRVAELTGLDPTVPSAARVLSAAVLTTSTQ